MGGRRESELRRIKVALAAAAVMAAVMALASPAVAVTGGLDQYSNSIGTFPLWGSDYSLAQTFTSGYLRPLTAVGIYASTFGPTSTSGTAARGSATLQIVPAYNGLPNTEFPLVTENVIIPASDGGQWVYFNFSSPPQVDLHGQYAIVVTVHAPWGMEWLGSCPSNAYKFGQASVKGPRDPYWQTIAQWNTVHHTSVCMGDFSFRTYVGAAATPPPALTAPPTAVHTAAPTATTGPGAFPPAPPTPHASATPTPHASTTATPATTSVVAPIVAGATGTPASSPTSTGAAAPDSGSGSGSSPSSTPPIAVFVLAAAGLGGAALFLIWKVPGLLAGRG